MKRHTLSCAIALVTGAIAGAANSAPETKNAMDLCMDSVLAKHPGTVVKVERKTESGEAVFELDVHGSDGKMYDIECSAATGKITEEEEEVETPDHPAFKAKAKISLAQAKDIALKQYPGEIKEIEYEIESDGAASYEVDIVSKDGKEIKVEVDATTGKIVEANEEVWQIGIE